MALSAYWGPPNYVLWFHMWLLLSLGNVPHFWWESW